MGKRIKRIENPDRYTLLWERLRIALRKCTDRGCNQRTILDISGRWYSWYGRVINANSNTN